MNVEVSRKEFSPLYNSKAESLKAVLLSDENSREKKWKAIQTFSETFTVIPSLLKVYDPDSMINSFEIAVSNLVDDSWANSVKIRRILSKSLNQSFDWHRFHPSTVKSCLEDIEKCKLYLQFPHSMLKKYYDFFHRYSSYPLPKEIEEKYRQSLILYEKIKAAESDNEKWLELVMETNDITFIIHNIERRIGSRPHEKQMWKLYIKFLRNFDLLDLMYHTYSRYCCLFTDDLEMREEFKKEIENDAISSEDILSKWKLKIVKIEINFGTSKNAAALFNKYFPSLKTEITTQNFKAEFQKIWTERKNKNPLLNNIMNTYMRFPLTRTSKKCIFKNDAIRQTFALPTTAMNFMIKNAKFEHLKKLHETSKYFYGKLKSPLCYKIMIGFPDLGVATFQQNLYISSEANDSALEAIKKCHVKDGLHIKETPPTFISSFNRDKIYKCEISTLSLYKQGIFMEDFLKIASTVKNFYVYNSHVFDQEYQKFSIPEIIAIMPSIKKLEVQESYFLLYPQQPQYPSFPPTSEVPEMERKLERFVSAQLIRANDPAKICEFLTKSITSNAIVDIVHCCSADEAERAKACILAMFESWKKDETFKPKVTIVLHCIDALHNIFRWILETPKP